MPDRATPSVRLRTAAGAGDMAAVRALFRDYQAWLGVYLCFQGFARELAGLPGRYSPPAGRLLLAEAGDAVVGGVGLWPLDRGVCEMKRLYVRPPWQGQGIGRSLAVGAIAAAREIGYTRMRLDSLARLTAALALYRALGFVAIPPYCANPLGDVVYLELDLERSAGGREA